MCPACVFLNFDIRDTPFCCCVTFTLSGKTVKMEGGVLRVQPCGAIWRIHCIYHFTPWSSETRVLVKSFRTFDWRRENILVLASVLLLRKLFLFEKKTKQKKKPEWNLRTLTLHLCGWAGTCRKLYSNDLWWRFPLHGEIPSAAAEIFSPTFLSQTFPSTSGQQFSSSLRKMTSEIITLA